MNTKIVRKNGLFLFALIASACVALQPARAATVAEKKAVLAAEVQFYSALNTMFTGDLGPMIKVWSHAADVTYMGPTGGFQVGWKKVLPVWKKQAAMKLGGTVKPEQIHMVVGSSIAVVQNYETGKNTNANGKTVKISIRATNVFRNENGKWKMIAHHTD
ncbi:MAG: YybH family protein, partial [Chthoniobacterales bacterium]